MGRTALVTGGAGFIGSELVGQLVGEGWTVRIVDNLVNGKVENVQPFLGPRCELIEADIRDRARLPAALADVDVVFHLACLGVRHSIHSPHENHLVNAEGTLGLLLAARERSVGRFVHVSSSEVYGTARTVPMTEEHPTFPETVYGASKLAGEAYARAFFRTYRFPTVVVRPFNAYGPRCHHEGDSGEVIPKFMLRCMAGLPLIVFGDGLQTRDFSYVSDTARGIALVAGVEGAVGETINLGSGVETSVLALAEAVARVVGVSRPAIELQPPRPGDVRRLVASSARVRALLGPQPTISLDEGLSRLSQHYAKLDRSPADLLAAETVLNWVGGAD